MMAHLWTVLLAPGLVQNAQVRSAVAIGTAVSLASAVAGVFVVIRGQAFLGHALSDMGAAGGSGAVLAGVQALWGYLVGGLVAGGMVDVASRRPGDRDMATGIVLAFSMGLGSLFLYLVTTDSSQAGVTQTILFGSLFTASPDLTGPVFGLSGLVMALIAALYRPLLLATVSEHAALARGVPVRLVNLLFLVAVVTAVEQSSLVVGALLSTALLVGPAGTAVRLARTPAQCVLLAGALSVAVTWAGVILAYDSYGWSATGVGWPVSFFITALTLGLYLLTYLRPARRRRAVAETAGVSA